MSISSRLSIEAGAAAIEAVSNSTSDASVALAILPHMISAWDFLDAETGEPIPITPATVAEALPWNYGGREVVLAMNEALERPLSSSPSESQNGTPSRSTRTGTTSRKRRSSSSPQSPSA